MHGSLSGGYSLLTRISAMLRNSYYFFIWDSHEHWKTWEYEKFFRSENFKIIPKGHGIFCESVKVQKMGSENNNII